MEKIGKDWKRIPPQKNGLTEAQKETNKRKKKHIRGRGVLLRDNAKEGNG